MTLWRKITLGLSLGIIGAVGLYFSRPPVNEAELSELSPVVLDRHGAWLTAFALDDGRWRFQADLEQIDPDFINALIEIEDRRYDSHFGVDIPAIFRAAKDWAKAGEVVSGASTITMQLVRQYKRRPRTLRSKAIEAVEAIRFELHYSKSEILAQYLTRISYGGNIEGLEAASRIYLGKSPRHLSDDEIALLLALPQAPEARRPDSQAAHAKRGRNRIVTKLVDAGLIDSENAEDVKSAPIPLLRHDLPQKAWLSSYYLAQETPHAQSFIDPLIQTHLEQHLSRYLSEQDETVNAAAVIVHAPTREVRGHAAIGSREHDGGWIDMTRRLRSPGSTLKPFVYGLGADDGVLSFDSLVRDTPSRFGTYQPENFNRRYHGDVRISEALQHSLNIPAVAVLDHVGGKRLQAALQASGAQLSVGRSDNPETGLSLALGGAGMRAVDLAALYTALANDGIAEPLRWHKDQGAWQSLRLLSETTAKDLRRIMAQSPVPAGHASGEILKSQPKIAYKTGTSYGFRDSWAAGLAGEYVIVIWVGRPDGAPRPGVTGRKAAAPLLFDIVSDLDVPQQAVSQDIARRASALQRVATPDEKGPQIIFPPENAEIAVRGFGDNSRGVTIRAQTSYGTPRIYVNGEAVTRQREGHIWHPDGPGFYELAVVDDRGKVTKTAFRVLSADQLVDAPF